MPCVPRDGLAIENRELLNDVSQRKLQDTRGRTVWSLEIQ